MLLADTTLSRIGRNSDVEDRPAHQFEAFAFAGVEQTGIDHTFGRSGPSGAARLQRFARIQPSVGVERLLDLALDGQLDGVELILDVVPFQGADSVLGGDRTAELQ